MGDWFTGGFDVFADAGFFVVCAYWLLLFTLVIGVLLAAVGRSVVG